MDTVLVRHSNVGPSFCLLRPALVAPTPVPCDKIHRARPRHRTPWPHCNTLGVCHSLSSGFELKHDRLSGDDDVKVNLWR
jgi:hypothetical protein